MAPAAGILLMAAIALLMAGPSAAAAGGGRKLLSCPSTSGCKNWGFPYNSASTAQLGDPGKDCSSGSNYCCSGCAIFEKYSWPVRGKSTWAYSGTKDPSQPPSAPLPDHFLVLPAAPCTGVESYVNTTGCGGEGIWDAAWATLPSSDQHTKALAINAVHHRTQHQMHMHVADIQKALGAWLQSLPVDGKWHDTSCGNSASSGNLHCQGSGAGISAKCEKVGSPSAMHPFNKIYGAGPTADSVDKWAGLVYSPRPGDFCAVQAQDRSAECLLYCSSECSTKPNLGCPA